MSIFEDVALEYKGESFIVPANNVMGLIGSIEEIITIEELASPNIKRVKLAKAYMAVLTYAGAKVSLEEVFNSLFGPAAMDDTLAKINALMGLMIPPEHLRVDAIGESDDEDLLVSSAGGKKKETDLLESPT